jgi:hypothetical protein
MNSIVSFTCLLIFSNGPLWLYVIDAVNDILALTSGNDISRNFAKTCGNVYCKNAIAFQQAKLSLRLGITI